MTSLGPNLLHVFVWLVAFYKISGSLIIKPEKEIQRILENFAYPILNITVKPANSSDILRITIDDPKDCLNLSGQNQKNINCTDGCQFSISSKRILDRESAVCSFFQLIINFKIRKESQTKIYRILVRDTNDNAPQFEKPSYKTSIQENFQGALSKLIIHATDRDEGPNGQVYYYLKAAGQNSANFNKTIAIDKITGRVKLLKPLDYETLNFYRCYVIAKDQGKKSLSSNASLWIEVIDVQDTPPVFIKTSFVTHIKENATIGTIVMNVSAVDGDRGNPNQIGYKLQGDVCKRFSMNETSGAITVNKSLNLTNSSFKNNDGVCLITLRAFELNNISSFTDENATIFIDDVNDNSPLFTASNYNCSIIEEANKDIPVTLDNAIQVTDDDQQVENAKFSLSLQNIDGSAFTALKVWPNEGISRAVLSLLVNDSSQLDYEKRTFLEFKIVAQGKQGMYRSSALVNLTILPANEFHPAFERNYTTCVPENVTENHPVITVKATDKDKGNDGNITYSLYGSNSQFLIDALTGKVTVGSNNLDYEQVQSYNLIVEATDGGNKKGRAQLHIYINDTNDEIPTFTSSVYRGTLTENENFTIKVEAKDKDKSGTPNSLVKYSIENVTQGLKENFTINHDTGEIRSIQIDNEQLESTTIIMVVMASDSGNPPQKNMTNVIIKVQGVNDNSPYFFRQNYNFSVPENASTGFNIGNVSAADNDREEINKKLTYFLINEIDKFRINSWNGTITVLGKLNREEKSQYRLGVQVIDGGTPSLSSSTIINIVVTDINDENPKFSPFNKITVYENCSVGSIIEKINATDPDSNANLVYRIFSQKILIDGKGLSVNKNSSKYFGINNTTGEVYVNQELDRETAELISLEIQVNDINAFGKPQFSKDQLKIEILDVNDCKPMFLKNISMKVMENLPIKSLITRVSATDADKDDKVTYKLKENYAQFEINKTSGEITLASELDREKNETIRFYVLAEDTKPIRHTSTATITLTVLDYNDNNPIFDKELYNKTYSISEDSKKGTEIVTVNATDADSGINSNISYFLAYRDIGEKLPICIHPITGKVFVCGALDREKTSFYNLEIQAKDMAGMYSPDTRTGNTWIKINVTDINDNSPIFSPSSYSASIQEDIPLGQSIIQVRATDKDTGSNSELSFSLKGNGSTKFKIDPFSGVIEVNLSLIDQVGSRTFSVIATDNGSPPRNNLANVTVKIIDTNNHAPKFPKNETVINIPEDTCANEIIFNVSATDADFDPQNKIVTYELKEEKEWEYFQLNRTSGQLKLLKQMDRETREIYEVEITAKDHGKPPLESKIFILKVNATNVDDEPPVFLIKDYPDFKKSFSVAEGKPKLSIGTITAYDSDPVSKPCYKIIDKTEYFQINSIDGSGEIVTCKELDYEKKKVFSFNLETYDCNHTVFNICGNVVKTEIHNKLSITVNLTDTNDNPPRFIHKFTRIAIQSDTKMNEIIENLTTLITDRDEYLENKKNNFKIFNFHEYGDLSAKDKPFLVDKEFLKANQSFHAAQKGYIQFSIKAYDSSGQFDTAVMKVYIVGKANKIKIMLLLSVEEVQKYKEEFCRELGIILQNNIKIVSGKIEPYQLRNGAFEKRRSNMYIYGIQNNTIMSAKELQDLIDLKTKNLIGFQNKYSVISIMSLQKSAATSSTSSKKEVIFWAVITLLTISLIVILLLFYTSNQRFKRKLKAAKIDVHSNKQDFEKWMVPGSNVHALGHSNPIYNKEISPDTALPEKISLNSLDMNEVGDSAVFVDPFDEQEIALDFIEDPANETSYTFQDISKTFLDNVIKEREAEMNKKNQNSESMSGHTNMALSVTSLETTDV